MDIEGCVWVGQGFLKNDKWQIKLWSEYFFQFTFNILWMTQTQEIITHMDFENSQMDMGDVYEWGKVLKEWQVTDKIIEWFFVQFTFNLLWMTQTQEIITHRILKIYKWIWGMCMSGGRFLKEWQVTDKIIEWIFFESHSNFYECLKLKKW